MGDNFTKTIIFVAGAAVGATVAAVVTYKKSWKKFSDILDEYDRDLKYLREALESMDEEACEDEDYPDYESEEETKTEYDQIVSTYVNTPTEKGEPTVFDYDKPYLIKAEEYGEYPEFSVVQLTYFADKVLVDEWDEVVSEDEIEKMIGKKSLEVFDTLDEDDDDTVYVRNNELEVDYEIMTDPRRYSDFASLVDEE